METNLAEQDGETSRLIQVATLLVFAPLFLTSVAVLITAVTSLTTQRVRAMSCFDDPSLIEICSDPAFGDWTTYAFLVALVLLVGISGLAVWFAGRSMLRRRRT